ncbi:hypothetical protein I4U23_017531 [Adineta vaga]|nr:hypothetical protein I4U23_017531 [Adineta vaga]
MSSTRTPTKSDYIQPSSILPYDPSQSPLALLAQTCSSIGKDSPLTLIRSSSPTPTSHVPKSSSIKRFSPSSQSISNKQSPQEFNHLLPQCDSTSSLTNLFLHSSLAYLASQYSYPPICTIPGCFQCHTAQYNFPPYSCHRKLSSEHDHIRSNHRLSKIVNHQRFHPYSKPSKLINSNDQLPYFYPYLSLSATEYLNNNKN